MDKLFNFNKGKGARDELDNYHGISILQVIAKLFEQYYAVR